MTFGTLKNGPSVSGALRRTASVGSGERGASSRRTLKWSDASVAPQMPMYQQQMVPQQYAPPHVAQFGPAFVPMPYQLPGAQMPQYLTVPEPTNDNVPWYLQLMRELGRSMVKAFGHQLAAHVDSHSIQKHKA